MSTSGKCTFAVLFPLMVGVALVEAEAAKCVAYSLSQSQKDLSEGKAAGTDVFWLGGITRPLGIVCVEDTKELILVGQVDETAEHLNVDGLVVALRAVLKHNFVPAVSIDITPDTNQTGKQGVRFEGGIERTQCGQDLFAADIVLKKLGMGVLSIGKAVPSYFDLHAANWQETRIEDSVRSRFWFLPSEQSFVAVRDGVIVINKFELDVGVEVLTNATIDSSGDLPDGGVRTDEIGSRFAQTLVAHQEALSQKYPELKRLEPLFRFVGLAQGLARLQKKENLSPDLSYWLDKYTVAEVETATEYPLLLWAEFLRDGDKAVRMVVEGGIDLEALVLELSDGDAQAFKEIVLLSKPEGNPLVWPVPLEGWPALHNDDNEVEEVVDPLANLSSHPLSEELSTILQMRFEEAYVQDDMQQRLEGITMMLPQQIHQPHALDMLQEQAGNQWQNTFSQPDFAMHQPNSPSFTPIDPPSFTPNDTPSFTPEPFTPNNSFLPLESFMPPSGFDVPEAISWMDQIETPPPSFETFEPEYHLLDTIEPLAQSMDSPLDAGWNAVHQFHQSSPTWNEPIGMDTFPSPLTPEFSTMFATPAQGYDSSGGLGAGFSAPTHSPISEIPSIQDSFQSYNQAQSYHNTIQQSDFGGGSTYSAPQIDLTPPGGFSTPSYSAPSYSAPSYSAPSYPSPSYPPP